MAQNTDIQQQREQDILKTGMELFGSLKEQKQNLFSKKRWYGRLMQWTLKRPLLKTPLFRFVDVFPSLNKKEDIAFFLSEYLTGDEKKRLIPSSLSKGAAFLSPALLSAFISKQMTEMSRLFILGEDTASILPGLRKIRKQACAFTLDLLGEATLSEKEALIYQNLYSKAISELGQETKGWKFNPLTDEDENGRLMPKVNISVKISSLDSRIFTEAFEDSKNRIKNKLRTLFQKGTTENAFINIDMEQYEYKNLTLDIFKELISEREFNNYPHFGIVIQAYLRSAVEDLQNLARFVKQRPAPITVRLVKGAYWDYELIHSRQNNWPCPVFLNKYESDQNFSACAELILKSYPYLRLAVASHNIRSISCALSRARSLHVPQKAIEVQTLYGMADTINHHLIKHNIRVRQYCPIGAPVPGMAYLVRRLLENTANESFIRSYGKKSLPNLLKAPEQNQASDTPPPQKTGQNPVNTKDQELSHTSQQESRFKNHPLLDFSIASHRLNFQKALEELKARLPLNIPLIINNEEKITDKKIKRENPSFPSQTIALVSQAGPEDSSLAVKGALKSFSLWSKTSARYRHNFFLSVADKMAKRRYSLSALQVLEVGKSWTSADADVCEAIDFCRYYAEQILKLNRPHLTDNVLGEESFYSYQARGLSLVIAPWNFPLAILTGMSTACLITGNTTLIKPAEQSSATAYELMKLLIECGLPAGVAQFLPGKGEETGAFLVQQKETELIAFTGSHKVGLSILEQANRVSKHNKLKKCIVEMGGKNAVIVDDSADLDMAVAGVLESAFEFQGQKCSACSRVLVAETIQSAFTERLSYAINSLTTGPAEQPEMRIGPVVDTHALKKIKAYIAEGKKTARLLSKELLLPSAGHFISPALFDQVPESSPLLKEEIFGPVLVLIPFKKLEQALKIANNTEFALTAGFYSRSPSRIETAKKALQAGNVYINRTCTGALVKRHPFGGFKMSGLGHKAGGPDYLIQFMNPKVVTENTVRRGFSPHLFTKKL